MTWYTGRSSTDLADAAIERNGTASECRQWTDFRRDARGANPYSCGRLCSTLKLQIGTPGVNVKIASIGLAMLMVGCANRPETIHASFVSHERFMDLNCYQMNARMLTTRAELDKFSKMQDSKATGDAWGVFLLGIPFSQLSGDHEGDVARLKGEVEAIETAQVKGKCLSGNGPTLNASTSQPAAVTASEATGTALSPYYTPQQQPDTQVARRAVGADTLQAETFGRNQSCSTAPVATLVAKGPGYETFSMACTNGDTIMVRCEYGNCRTLR